mmetsp:Transcript_35936/g.94218  ORF Transcript_35936/g.94218 Transcript_35936/m.94218 type:complete len:365 (-) Transcript_35936:342-1436(-)
MRPSNLLRSSAKVASRSVRSWTISASCMSVTFLAVRCASSRSVVSSVMRLSSWARSLAKVASRSLSSLAAAPAAACRSIAACAVAAAAASSLTSSVLASPARLRALSNSAASSAMRASYPSRSRVAAAAAASRSPSSRAAAFSAAAILASSSMDAERSFEVDPIKLRKSTSSSSAAATAASRSRSIDSFDATCSRSSLTSSSAFSQRFTSAVSRLFSLSSSSSCALALIEMEDLWASLRRRRSDSRSVRSSPPIRSRSCWTVRFMSASEFASLSRSALTVSRVSPISRSPPSSSASASPKDPLSLAAPSELVFLSARLCARHSARRRSFSNSAIPSCDLSSAYAHVRACSSSASLSFCSRTVIK